MKFLLDIKDSGYPTDYLLSRIHGRRIFLIEDWDNVLAYPDISEYLMSTHYRDFIGLHPAEGIRTRLLKEMNWVYHQMNKNLRHIFQSYFIYTELNTLLVCMRYKLEKGHNTEIERILEFSLLSESIKDVLKTCPDIPCVLDLLENKLAFLSDRLAGLKDVFEKDGPARVERKIRCALLEYLADFETHPVIRRFFTSIVDSANIISLYKHLRWDITANPLFIRGGSFSESFFDRAMHSSGMSEIADIVHKQTGLRIPELNAAGIDSALLKGMTRQIKLLERESPDIGLILNYLWRCSIEARNLSILSYGEKVDKSVIKQELVY